MNNPTIGSHSPWGAIDDAKEIAEGIVSVGTPSHGGIWLSPERFAQMPACLRNRNWLGEESNWFEEDCSWLLVVARFPECFSEGIQGEYKAQLELQYPGVLALLKGGA